MSVPVPIHENEFNLWGKAYVDCCTWYHQTTGRQGQSLMRYIRAQGQHTSDPN